MKSTTTARNSSFGAALTLIALIVAFVPNANAVTIPTVPVGNLGNGNDPATGNLYGGVGYAYNIGTTEVTVGQYTAFLNAVAAADTYALYDTRMATAPQTPAIARSGVSGSYSYSVIGSSNHPVVYVSWGDAARFSNWLHNGKPTGVEGPGTTETGAYTLNGALTNAALGAVSRNASATWFIPTENEWYKAAYYQPAAQGGDVDNYWTYPMRTNSTPYSDQPPGATPDNTRVGNFYRTDSLANGYNDGYAVTGSTTLSGSQNYLTDVGAYTSSSSFYGTFDQGGNAYEWNELLILGAQSHFSRRARGGSWYEDAGYLATTIRSSVSPEDGYFNIGFRVATVPESSTDVLAIIAGVLMLWWKRRYK